MRAGPARSSSARCSTSRAWSTTCWTCRASRAARSNCAASAVDIETRGPQCDRNQPAAHRRRPAPYARSSTLPREPIRLLGGDPVRLAQVLLQPAQQRGEVHPEPAGTSVSARGARATRRSSRVKDNGIGIDEPAAAARIRYVHAGRRTASAARKAGSASALRWCAAFVGMHGGTVEARATGRVAAASSSIRLPVLEAAEAMPAAARSHRLERPQRRDPHRRRQPGRRRRVWRCCSQMQGNEVHTAYDGPQAVEAVAQFHPDVVLLDIGTADAQRL